MIQPAFPPFLSGILQNLEVEDKDGINLTQELKELLL